MITSKSNESFKYWKKLMVKKFRDQAGEFLVYGPHLVAKAKAAGCVVSIITSDPNVDGILISAELIKELNHTETAFDVIALCKKINNKNITKRILAFDDLQDPNNVGALIRSAVAFGFDHIIFSHKSADLYNEKVIRASQGAIFDISIERGNIESILAKYQTDGYLVYIADAHATTNINSNLDKLIIVLGNEGNGISSDVKKIADGTINIKTNKVESLNVAVAGSILMYEWRVIDGSDN